MKFQRVDEGTMFQADIVQQSQEPDWPNLNFSHPASPQTQTHPGDQDWLHPPSHLPAVPGVELANVFRVLLIYAVLEI